MSSLRPTEGARFLLELARDDGAHATYRVAIHAPDATYPGTARLGDDGSVELACAAPDALAEALHMFAKLIARGATTRREAGRSAWPARVLRWRGPGRGE